MQNQTEQACTPSCQLTPRSRKKGKKSNAYLAHLLVAEQLPQHPALRSAAAATCSRLCTCCRRVRQCLREPGPGRLEIRLEALVLTLEDPDRTLRVSTHVPNLPVQQLFDGAELTGKLTDHLCLLRLEGDHTGLW